MNAVARAENLNTNEKNPSKFKKIDKACWEFVQNSRCRYNFRNIPLIFLQYFSSVIVNINLFNININNDIMRTVSLLRRFFDLVCLSAYTCFSIYVRTYFGAFEIYSIKMSLIYAYNSDYLQLVNKC